MDFQSAMETFAEAWMAANTKPSVDQCDVKAERTNGRLSEEELRVTHTQATNGGSPPNRDSPLPLARDADGRSPPRPLPNGIKSIPIHVVIETIPLCEASPAVGVPGSADGRPRVEADSYALVPSHARFDDLLQIVLIKTGFVDDMSCARGLLQLRHWRGVPLDQVAADGDTTVGEVLGELAALATLHVRIYSSHRARTARSLRERLMRVLLSHSQHLLTSAGCPLDQNQLASLIRGGSTDYHHLSDESLRQFETWWALQIAHASANARQPPLPPPPHPHLTPHGQPGGGGAPPHAPPQHHSSQSPHLHSGSPHHTQSSGHSGGGSSLGLPQPNVTVASAANLLAGPVHHHHHHPNAPPMSLANDNKLLPDPLHPALQSMTGTMMNMPKTRMRTSFDPEFELPRLQRWFAENQHPTRLQIQHYVTELNSLESRKGRKPLDINNVVYWFKNARAAYKRQEYRSLNGMKTPPPEDISDSEDYHSSHHNSSTPPHHQLLHHTQLNSLHSVTTSPTSAATNNQGNGSQTCTSPQHSGSSSASSVSTANAAQSTTSSTCSSTSSSSNQPLNLHNNCNTDPPNNNNNTVTKDEKMDESKDDSPSISPDDNGREASSVSSNGENLSVKRKLEEDDKLIVVKEESVADSTMSAPATPRSPQSVPNTSDVSPSHRNSSHQPGGSSDACGSQAGDVPQGDDSPLNSDVDMSDDEEGARSRDSVLVSEEKRCHSPMLSPGATGGAGLGLSPYTQLSGLGQGGVDRFAASVYPAMPNSLLQTSMMYMAHYMPPVPPFPGGLMPHGSLPEERRKRNRTFIDPVTEVPRLEQWFTHNTHPSHNLILKYTEELNRMPYRQKFPRLEPKNVQFWFKNRRAKCKRLRVSM